MPFVTRFLLVIEASLVEGKFGESCTTPLPGDEP